MVAVNGESILFTKSSRSEDSSLEGIHHDLHLLLHYLHFCDDRRWGEIHERWEAYVLPLRSAWGIVAFRPLLLPSLGTVTFLVLLLKVRSCIPLAYPFGVAAPPSRGSAL